MSRVGKPGIHPGKTDLFARMGTVRCVDERGPDFELTEGLSGGFLEVAQGLRALKSEALGEVHLGHALVGVRIEFCQVLHDFGVGRGADALN